jgi:hypothetical protein
LRQHFLGLLILNIWMLSPLGAGRRRRRIRFWSGLGVGVEVQDVDADWWEGEVV